MVPVYRGEIAALATRRRPAGCCCIVRSGARLPDRGIPIGGNQTMIAAAGKSGIPSPVELMLAGHIHTFEAINYGAKDRVCRRNWSPVSAATMLDRTPLNLKGRLSGLRASPSGMGFQFAASVFC